MAADIGAEIRKTIEPLVPVDLVVDHSVMVDYYGTKKALNWMKWSSSATRSIHS